MTSPIDIIRIYQAAWQKQHDEATGNALFFKGAIEAASMIISRLEAPVPPTEPENEQHNSVSEGEETPASNTDEEEAAAERS